MSPKGAKLPSFELFRRFWNLSDDEPLITDASAAEDSLVEDLIIRAQGSFKEVTDKLVEISSVRSGNTDNLQELRDDVILAYSAALDGDLEKVKDILGRIVNV